MSITMFPPTSHYFAPTCGLKYSDKRVFFSLFAYISQKQHVPTFFTKSSVGLLTVVMARSSFDGVVVRYVLLVVWMWCFDKLATWHSMYISEQ